jgi:hypothetical protein
MKKLPEKYRSKIETIKRAILVRSGLLSEFGRSVTIELTNYDFQSNVDTENITFYELVFSLKINTSLECDDCSHNPNDIMGTINSISNRIYKASKFFIDDDLIIKNGSSLRGVLIDYFTFNVDEINNLEFSIFYDVGEEY